MTKRRYAVCGVSSRAIGMWIQPMYREFANAAEFVGMLDIDPIRFNVCKKQIPESANVPTYMPEEFDKMIEETKPDAIFVVCRDCYHVTYILKALEKGLDVITEKPMTTNWEDGIKVREAEKKIQGQSHLYIQLPLQSPAPSAPGTRPCRKNRPRHSRRSQLVYRHQARIQLFSPLEPHARKFRQPLHP